MNTREIHSLCENYLENSTIDSRMCKNESIFFALKGEKFDGHDFIEEAFKNGAKYSIISKEAYKINDRCLVVNDVFETLVYLAKYKRAQLNIPIIAITGSAGKTTTKELCREILSKKYKIFATYKSFNSKVTVPISILSIPKDCQMAILEIGASGVNDIQNHCEIIQPTHGIITSIRPVHLEGFGSIDNIIKGKTELYDYLNNNNGIAFVNYFDEVLPSEAARRPNMKVFFYQKDLENIFTIAQNVENENNMFLNYTSPSGKNIQTHFFGNFNLDNIAAASTIGTFFGVGEEKISDAISNYIPKNNRSEYIKTKNNNIIILDAYNANLFAVIECAKLFSEIKMLNKILILGAMRELSEKCIDMHRELGIELAKLSFDHLYLLGEDMVFCKNVCPHAVHFNKKEDLISHFSQQHYTNHNFFIKGARYWGLEDVVDFL